MEVINHLDCYLARRLKERVIHFPQHSLDCIYKYGCGLPRTRRALITLEQVHQKPHRQLGLEHRSCEEKLKSWGLFSLEKRWLWQDPMTALWNLVGNYWEETESGCLLEVHGTRTEHNSPRWKHWKFHVCFTLGMIKPWGRDRRRIWNFHLWRFSRPNCTKT